MMNGRPIERCLAHPSTHPSVSICALHGCNPPIDTHRLICCLTYCAAPRLIVPPVALLACSLACLPDETDLPFPRPYC